MRRVISIVLLICIALTCISVQAFAETDYSAYAQQVTAKKGDSVVSLCIVVSCWLVAMRVQCMPMWILSSRVVMWVVL